MTDIDEATLVAAVKIAKLLVEGANDEPRVAAKRYCIVRGDRSGVFAGEVVSEDGQTVEMTDVRHLWYWQGAANTAEIAERGVAQPAACKFTAPARRIRVLDAIEVIDCEDAARDIIRAVPAWSEFK